MKKHISPHSILCSASKKIKLPLVIKKGGDTFKLPDGKYKLEFSALVNNMFNKKYASNGFCFTDEGDYTTLGRFKL